VRWKLLSIKPYLLKLVCYKGIGYHYYIDIPLKRRKRNDKALIKEDYFTAATEPVTANRICLVVDLAFPLKVFI